MKPLGLLRPANIMDAPDWVDHVLLSTSGQAFDTPAGAAFVAFSANVDFTAKYGSTGVTWPSTNMVLGTGSEMNPTIRCIGSTLRTTGISIIAGSSGLLTLSWFKPGG